ncbi:ATP-binding protein [bacterium]|nr:ATP-binding protein [bacterium]
MEANKLFEALIRWNYWSDKPLPELRDRIIMQTIHNYIDDKLPIILSGVRRSGKSSIFLLIISELLSRGVDPKQILFLNFEEPQFSTLLSPTFIDDLVTLYKQRINPNKKIYFFLDEIQNVPEWQRWVRREADLKDHKVFATGSSAKLLSSEISTLLTGRYIQFNVHPLSLREILNWNSISYTNDLERTENKSLIINKLFEYLQWGGFPEIILSENEERKKRILSQYFSDILYRDIVYRHQIRDVKLLEGIAHYCITNISSLHSFNRISNIFHTPIDNVRRYFSFLEEAFLITSATKFSFKLSEQKRSPKKVFTVDNGLRNQYGFRFSSDAGKLAENTVAMQLLRSIPDLFYLSNGGECDFIIRRNKQFIPIQVTMDNLETDQTRNREIKGLINAMNYLNVQTGLLITNDIEKTESIDKLRINYIPLWKFLLQHSVYI